MSDEKTCLICGIPLNPVAGWNACLKHRTSASRPPALQEAPKPVCPQPGHGKKFMHGDTLLCMECGGLVPATPQAGRYISPAELETVDAQLGWQRPLLPSVAQCAAMVAEIREGWAKVKPPQQVQCLYCSLISDLGCGIVIYPAPAPSQAPGEAT